MNLHLSVSKLEVDKTWTMCQQGNAKYPCNFHPKPVTFNIQLPKCLYLTQIYNGTIQTSITQTPVVVIYLFQFIQSKQATNLGKDIDIEHVCVCVNATQLTVAEDLIDDSKSGDTVTFMY